MVCGVSLNLASHFVILLKDFVDHKMRYMLKAFCEKPSTLGMDEK